MSYSSISNLPSGDGGLPAPDIRLADPLSPLLTQYNPNGIGYSVSVDGNKLDFLRMPMHVPTEMDSSFFDKDLRLEVLYYRKGGIKKNLNTGARKRMADGFAHPAHSKLDSYTGGSVPAQPLLGSNRRGGRRNQSGGVLQPSGFISEYEVQKAKQTFFIDGMGSFLSKTQVAFNGALGGEIFEAYVTNNKSKYGSNANFRGFGYAPLFHDMHVQFQYSIVGDEDPRNRIVGPKSSVFVIGPAVHPMRLDVARSEASTDNSVIRELATNYRATLFNTWLQNRVPSNLI